MWFDGQVFGANTDETPNNPLITRRVRIRNYHYYYYYNDQLSCTCVYRK